MQAGPYRSDDNCILDFPNLWNPEIGLGKAI